MGRVKKARRPQELTGVGIGDFIRLIGVQPDLLLATAKDTGGKPLLKPEHTHGRGRSGERKVFPSLEELSTVCCDPHSPRL